LALKINLFFSAPQRAEKHIIPLLKIKEIQFIYFRKALPLGKKEKVNFT
jgi:hypothetical protein